jgi:hypothetical protein
MSALCLYSPRSREGVFSKTGLPALGVLANTAGQRGHNKRARATIPGPSLTLFALTTASGTATTDAAASTVATDVGSSAALAADIEIMAVVWASGDVEEVATPTVTTDAGF